MELFEFNRPSGSVFAVDSVENMSFSKSYFCFGRFKHLNIQKSSTCTSLVKVIQSTATDFLEFTLFCITFSNISIGKNVVELILVGKEGGIVNSFSYDFTVELSEKCGNEIIIYCEEEIKNDQLLFQFMPLGGTSTQCCFTLYRHFGEKYEDECIELTQEEDTYYAIVPFEKLAQYNHVEVELDVATGNKLFCYFINHPTEDRATPLAFPSKDAKSYLAPKEQRYKFKKLQKEKEDLYQELKIDHDYLHMYVGGVKKYLNRIDQFQITRQNYTVVQNLIEVLKQMNLLLLPCQCHWIETKTGSRIKIEEADDIIATDNHKTVIQAFEDKLNMFKTRYAIK